MIRALLLILFWIPLSQAGEEILSSDGIQILPSPTTEKKELKNPLRKKPKRKLAKTQPPPPVPTPPAPAPIVTSPPPPPPSPTPTPTPSPSPTPVPSITPLPPVRATAQPEKRRVASANLREGVDRKSPARVNLALGGTLGLNYAFPSLSVEVLLARPISLTASGIFFSNFRTTDRQTAVGLLVSGSVYLSGENFRGLFLRAGAGAYSLTAMTDTGQENSSPFAVLGTINWRVSAFGALNLGFGAGVQYVTGSATPAIKFTGALPLFTVDLGYAF